MGDKAAAFSTMESHYFSSGISILILQISLHKWTQISQQSRRLGGEPVI